MRGKAWMLTAVALTGLGLAQIRADGSSTVYPITQAVAEEFTECVEFCQVFPVPAP